jgi:hypothetical protein
LDVSLDDGDPFNKDSDMGKATGIIASVGITLGSFIAGRFAMDPPAAANAAHPPVTAPWNITSLDDLQRIRNQAAQQTINPATGRPDPYATVQAWVEQTEAQEAANDRGRATLQQRKDMNH